MQEEQSIRSIDTQGFSLSRIIVINRRPPVTQVGVSHISAGSGDFEPDENEQGRGQVLLFAQGLFLAN